MMRIFAEEFQNEGQHAIQTAVDVCAKEGGGEVVISKGEWQTGPIHLSSHIHIILEEERQDRPP